MDLEALAMKKPREIALERCNNMIRFLLKIEAVAMDEVAEWRKNVSQVPQANETLPQ